MESLRYLVFVMHFRNREHHLLFKKNDHFMMKLRVNDILIIIVIVIIAAPYSMLIMCQVLS